MKTLRFSSIMTLYLIMLQASFAYELISFSPTKPRSIENLLKETGLSKDQLSLYKCDNPNRVNLFFKTRIENTSLDSLKIYDKKNEKIYTYFAGKIYGSDNRLASPKSKFVKLALKTLNIFEEIPETRELIRELQSSKFKLYITKGGNRFLPHSLGERTAWHMNDATMIANLDEKRPMIDKIPFSQIGYGGFINWNPNSKMKFVESDGKTRFVDTRVVLAHEMMHAYDSTRGILDRRFVKSEHHEFQTQTEYRAVRMENILRKSLGQKNRKFYGTPDNPDDDKDMLDKNGETLILPTPCIRWL